MTKNREENARALIFSAHNTSFEAKDKKNNANLCSYQTTFKGQEKQMRSHISSRRTSHKDIFQHYDAISKQLKTKKQRNTKVLRS